MNTTPVRAFIVTLFKADDLHTLHFLTHRAGDVWNYYELNAVRSDQSASHLPSLINRAAALYRYVAGQPTDQEPPLAR